MTNKFIKGLLLTIAAAAAAYTGANVADLNASAHAGTIITTVAATVGTLLKQYDEED